MVDRHTLLMAGFMAGLGYRTLWMMVLFDLPVVEDNDRKAAGAFRLTLRDLGFEMVQFSVYMRHLSGKEAAEALRGSIEDNLPPSGKVHIVTITDKQYEAIRTYFGRRKGKKQQNPNQLTLF